VDADPGVSGWLRSRGIDPALVAALDLARALPSAAENVVTVATWARFGRASWGRGWRLILPCFNAAGELVTLRARWTTDGPVKVKEGGGTDVAAGPAVYADPMGRELLRGVTPLGWDGRVIFVEGGPDFLTLATSTSSTSTTAPAVVGVWSGAWPATQAGAAFAERLPARARVCLATDANDAGDRYADTIAARLTGRPWLRVRAPQIDNDARTRDWNDLARAGERPLDLIDAAMKTEPEVTTMADERSAVVRLVTSERVELRPLRDLADVAFDRMEARGRGEESCLPVPWHDLAKVLDSDLAKLQPSTNAVGWSNLPALRPGVHVLVGGTGSGKTQLALSLALAAARSGHPVGYVGLELDPVGVVARLAALQWASRRKEVEWSDRWSAIDWPRGPDTQKALAKIRREVASELAGLPLDLAFGDARGGRLGFTADDFALVADGMAARGTPQRPALVVLDFLQLLAPDPKQPDDREIRTRIARAAYAAANATRDGRCAVLLVSATARDKYGALDGLKVGELPDVRSLVGTGKESGEIEYAATSVLVMARCSDAPDDRLVGVAKNRHGGTGWAALPWDGSAFYNVPGRLEQLLKPDAKTAAEQSTGRKPKVYLR
jgi:hypothetical protein